MNSYIRRGFALTLVAISVALSGCSPEQGIALRVNNETLTMEEYYKRVQTVRQIPTELATDAGGLTLMNATNTMLAEQLAKDMGTLPPDTAVGEAVEYQMRTDANLIAAVRSGKLTELELVRAQRFQMAIFAIGTNGAKAKEEDITKEYNNPENKAFVDVKEIYIFRGLQVPDEDTGKKTLESLKKTGDFVKAAESLGFPPASARNAANELVRTGDTLPKEVSDALKKLKPNEFAPTPVTFTMTNPQAPNAPPQKSLLLLQLRELRPARKVETKEIRYLLEQMILAKSHPQWAEQYQTELAKYAQKAQIHVGIKKYAQTVDDFIKQQTGAFASRQQPVSSGGSPTSGSGAPMPKQ